MLGAPAIARKRSSVESKAIRIEPHPTGANKLPNHGCAGRARQPKISTRYFHELAITEPIFVGWPSANPCSTEPVGVNPGEVACNISGQSPDANVQILETMLFPGTCQSCL
eukprot:8900991-Karenia_brevis.AAC.1